MPHRVAFLLLTTTSAGCAMGFGPVGVNAALLTPKACVEQCADWDMEMSAMVALHASAACVCTPKGASVPGEPMVTAAAAATAAHQQAQRQSGSARSD